MAKKKISWLDQFASDYNAQLQKTASLDHEAAQIIVDCSAYPNAKVGSLVDFENHKYKIIDPNYHNEAGPGILLEKLAESDFCSDPMENATVSNGEVKATSIEDDSKNCGPFCGEVKTAADKEADELLREAISEYPDTITKPGGVKPAPSADIEGPGKKNVTDAPYHPTYDPGEQYALDIDEDWETAAKQTAEAIRQEDAQDRTTVKGYYTWNQNIILDKIVDDVELAKELEENDANDDAEEVVEETEETEEDELAEFDDSKGAENETSENEETTEEEIVDDEIENDADESETEEEDELAEFDDSKDAVDDDDEEVVEEEITDEDADDNDDIADESVEEEITDEDDDESADSDDSDFDEEEITDEDETEDEIDEEKDDKKAEASLRNSNRIIARLASL